MILGVVSVFLFCKFALQESAAPTPIGCICDAPFAIPSIGPNHARAARFFLDEQAGNLSNDTERVEPLSGFGAPRPVWGGPSESYPPVVQSFFAQSANESHKRKKEKHAARIRRKNQRRLAAGKDVPVYYTKHPNGGFSGGKDLQSTARYPQRLVSAIFSVWFKWFTDKACQAAVPETR